MALVKYNNNSISAITAASSLTTGAMTLIKEITASSDDTIDFVDGASDVVLDSTYPIYLFKFINIHPSNDGAQFTFQGNAAGGSGFDETITSTIFYAYHNEADNDTTLSYRTAADQAQGTAFQILTDSIGNDNDQSVSGKMQLFSPSSTVFVKHFLTVVSNSHNSDMIKNTYTAGYYNTTSALDAMQFTFSSGNIDLGDICLYGLTT